MMIYLKNKSTNGLTYLLSLVWFYALFWGSLAAQEPLEDSGNSSQVAPSSATTQQVVAHPAFVGLVDKSLPWVGLSSEGVAQNSEKLMFLLTPSRQSYPEVNRSILQALTGEALSQYSDKLSFVLASPAWWPILDQRLFYSTVMNPQQAVRNMTLSSQLNFNLLNTHKQIEVVAFQQPSINYQTQDWKTFVDSVLTRYNLNKQGLGLESRFARTGRFSMLETYANPEVPSVDLSNLYVNIAGVLSREEYVNARIPTDYLQTLWVLSQAKQLDQAQSIGQTQREQLFDVAQQVAKRSWEAWEGDELLLFEENTVFPKPASVTHIYSLGENCRFLILTKLFGEENKQRSLTLLSELEKAFISADGIISDQVIQLKDGTRVASGWCRLHNRALLAQARLHWRGKDADLSWLEQAAELAKDEQNPRFPAALEPAFPEDPDSLLGIVYLGQACLLAADVHPQDKQLWVERSKAIFELFEERFSAGEKGYWMLPKEHPLTVPPEAFFVSSPDQSNSLLTQHGTWLRALEAQGVEAAGKRADELLKSYTRWRLVRSPQTVDLYFTRGIPLQKAE